MSATRIPGSRELLWILQANFVHPVVWSKGQFVVSGIGFACLLCLLALHGLYVAFELLFNPASVRALVKSSDNPIRSDMDSLMALLGSGSFLTSSLYVACYVHVRKKLALVFNDLNSVWLMLGCPRQRFAFAAFVALPWSLFLIAHSVHTLVSDRVDLLSSPILEAARILDQTVTFVFRMNAFSANCVLMIFVYGSLIDSVSSLLLSIESSASKNPNVETSLTSLLPVVARLLSTYSSVVSKLITLSLMALVCLVLQILFLNTIGSSGGGAVAMSPIIAGVGALLAIALTMSHLLEEKIVEVRESLRIKHVSKEISSRAFQELHLMMKSVKHPAKIFNVLHLNMSVVISMVTFFLNYYMTFIQFKAILAGTPTNSTAST